MRSCKLQEGCELAGVICSAAGPVLDSYLTICSGFADARVADEQIGSTRNLLLQAHISRCNVADRCSYRHAWQQSPPCHIQVTSASSSEDFT